MLKTCVSTRGRRLGGQSIVPVLREDGCIGLGLPRTFIRWLRFWAGIKKKKNRFQTRDERRSVDDRRLLRPPHPPGLSFLQGGALGLHRVVDDAAGPPREIHGDQGVLGHAPLWWGEGEWTRVRGQISQTQSLGHDQSCLPREPAQSKNSSWGFPSK